MRLPLQFLTTRLRFSATRRMPTCVQVYTKRMQYKDTRGVQVRKASFVFRDYPKLPLCLLIILVGFPCASWQHHTQSFLVFPDKTSKTLIVLSNRTLPVILNSDACFSSSANADALRTTFHEYVSRNRGIAFS